jgi:lipopolysaccharide transport system ATP-binding protein
MTGETARIHVEGLSLSVPTFLQDDRSASSWLSTLAVAAFRPSRREWRTILSDISFELRDGDRLALLGRNGAGKSTLLRVLNGAFHPTRGTVEVSGSRQALLNIALGFNGEATVRENVFLRGTAMGLPLKRLHELVPEILAFAGLEEKANHRLKTLSSGQRMRLGFSVSTCVQHDVMLMDEWIGTGDSEFIARAKQRMSSRVNGSRIVVLASHNTGLLKDVCNKGMVLEDGKMVFFGDIMSSLKAYHTLMATPRVHDTHGPVDLATYGCLEEASLVDGVLHLRGWAAHGGGAAKALGVDILGERHLLEHVERVARGDVQRNLGLADVDCGFRATLPLPGIDTLSQLRGNLHMFGGGTPERMDGPFRLGPAVLKALEP